MATIESPPPDDIRDVEMALNAPEPSEPRLHTLKLSQFKQLVRTQIAKSGSNVELHIVLNGDWALAQFKGPTPHRIRVLPDNLFRGLHRFLGIGLSLREGDFEVAAGHSTIHGYRRPISLLTFIRGEPIRNLIFLLALFFSSGFSLNFAVETSGQADVVETASEVIIQVSAIYFSVFMLFVAAQGLPTRLGKGLFENGLTHRFFAIDRLISVFSLLALSLAAFTRILVEFPESNSIWILGMGRLELDLTVVFPWTTAVAITLMAYSLVAFAGYYIDRSRRLVESEMSKELLDEVLTPEERHSDD
jgi:hypothetical protein